jgi:cell wall-associated NlpC family hydrolase
MSLVFVGSAAHAQPSVSQLEQQLDTAWNKLEPTIEKQNAIRGDLAVKKQKAAALQKKIEPLQLQVDLAMDQVGALASRYYMGDKTSAFNSLLGSGSPTDFADKLSLLDVFAKERQDSIKKVVALKAQYDAQKKPLDSLVAQLTQTEADLTATAKLINGQITQLQALRLKAYGTTGATGVYRPAACPYDYIGGKAGTAAKFACAQIGKPYVWDAAGPGSYDCSGLVMAAWAKAGVSMPHNAAQQRQTMRSVSRSQLQPGDLVFFFSDVHHVAMYVGGGWVVHAPTTGDVVRMAKIDNVAPINSYGRPG